MITKNVSKYYLALIVVCICVGLISAEDIVIWQGQYYTGTTFNTGTYTFNFTVYDNLTNGNICYSNTTSLTTGTWGEWKTEQYNVSVYCNNISKSYFLNINISGIDQTPRRRLTLFKYLRKDVQEIGTFAYVDKLEQVTAPSTPPNNTLRLFVEDVHGFSFYSFLDDTGMTRKIVRDSVFVGKANGTAISLGQAVYACGSSGNTPQLCLANANSTSTMPAIGIAIENIGTDKFGRVMQVGLLEKINTNQWAEGNVLYVSDNESGNLTTVLPLGPSLKQELGTVLVKHQTQGQLQIISRSVQQDETGTAQNIWYLGDGTSGVKKIVVNNGVKGNLSWNPTAAREIQLPDASGTICLASNLTGNYSVGACWIYFTNGTATSTNCTSI